MKLLPLDVVDPLADKLYYRYASRIESCGYFDADGDWVGSRSEIKVVVRLEVFREIRKTPKGAWIEVPFHGKKFVLDHGRKRYAWPTQELAWESFVARKQKQIRLLSRQVAAAEAAIEKGPPRDREIEKSFYLYLGEKIGLS